MGAKIILSFFLLIFHSFASKTAQREELESMNKKMAVGFLREFFGDKNVTAADKYICAEKYIQHNPLIADGREALKTAAREWFRLQPARAKVDIRRTAADKDLVWIHHKTNWAGKSVAVIDIFRFDKRCKIVEHWDAIREIPEMSENSNPVI